MFTVFIPSNKYLLKHTHLYTGIHNLHGYTDVSGASNFISIS